MPDFKKHLNTLMSWFLPQSFQELVVAMTGFLRVATAGLKRFQEPVGLYEVLVYEARLELLDTRGNAAIYEKRERVRFLKDCATGFYDYGWGDGQAFTSHRVKPGRIVRREAHGSRQRSLILLPVPKRQGETFSFSIRRRIQDGFRDAGEWWLEVEVYHRTRRIRLIVVLPTARPARRAWVVTRGNGGREVVPLNHRRYDGKQELRYIIREPKVGERLTLAWEW